MSKQLDRISEMIQRRLAEVVPRELQDPRLGHFVTISAVKVGPALKYAKVYFTVLDCDKNEATVILNARAPFLRNLLAQSLKLRTVPELHFVYDDSIEYGKKLSRLIDEVDPDQDHEK